MQNTRKHKQNVRYTKDVFTMIVIIMFSFQKMYDCRLSEYPDRS